MYYAHSTPKTDRSDWQVLPDHLNEVARLAGLAGDKFGAGRLAAFAGLVHDLGKYSKAFDRRLSGGRNRVDHSTAGAALAYRLAGPPGKARSSPAALALELVAYLVAGHHAGLPDMTGGAGALSDRVQHDDTALDAVWQSEIAVDAQGLRLPDFRWLAGEPKACGFQIAMLGRMLFSCLVDADFRDTEAFYAKVDGHKRDRDWPALPDIVDDLTQKLDAALRAKMAAAPDNAVNRLRAKVLATVHERAALAPGVFTLTVPTGGGKTLASLAFALDHAKTHRKARVIVAIPFTSVIDQTAAIYRDILGQDVVLEHHSAVELDTAETENTLRESARDAKLRLAMEDWAAPIVVTTNVQLFESLFAHRTSRCRKLHNLAGSIIILDEAQTIPRHVLLPSIAALDELARNYGATIVLCTATQPALRQMDGFANGFAIGPERELAPDPDALARALRRVTLTHGGEMDDAALVEALGETRQGLVIVNTRAHALALFRQAQEAGLDGLVHLTTRQCATHRRQILARIRAMLDDKATPPCRVVATSLVEAGVDLDFPRLWRAEAGLEQILQAAGRCNREGKNPAEESIVTVFRAAGVEPPREIAQLAEDLARVALSHPDLLSLDALLAYFQEVYWRKGDGLDQLRINGEKNASIKVCDSFKVDRSGTGFYYRKVGENFRLIDSAMAPVVIPFDETAREALASLASPETPAGAVARTLQPYIVQIPPRARAQLIAAGDVRFVEEARYGNQFAMLVNEKAYRRDAADRQDRDVGLVWEQPGYVPATDLMC